MQKYITYVCAEYNPAFDIRNRSQVPWRIFARMNYLGMFSIGFKGHESLLFIPDVLRQH